MDLRNDQEVLNKIGQPLSQQDGENLSKELGAKGYVECSALTQDGLKGVFDEAIRAAMAPTQKKRWMYHIINPQSIIFWIFNFFVFGLLLFFKKFNVFTI